MAYSEKVKNKILGEIESGKPVSIVAGEYNISKSTIYNWRKKIVEEKTSDELKHKVLKEIATKKPIIVISKQYNISPATIYNWKRRALGAEAMQERLNKDKERTYALQKMEMLEKKENLEEAKTIAEEFQDNEEIQSKLMAIYMDMGKYQEAKAIAEKFLNYGPIQSKIITMYIRTGQYKIAEEIGKKFSKDPVIQFQMVELYMQTGEYEKAKKIANKFENDRTFQLKFIGLLQRKGRFQQADKVAKKLSNKVIKKVEKRETRKEVTINDIDSKDDMLMKSVQIILEQINNNPNDHAIMESIEQLDDKWLKLILNSALGEKINIKTPALQFVKKLIKEDCINEAHKPVIQDLRQRLEKKVKFFDVRFYEKLIIRAIGQNNSKKNNKESQDDERI